MLNVPENMAEPDLRQILEHVGVDAFEAPNLGNSSHVFLCHLKMKLLPLSPQKWGGGGLRETGSPKKGIDPARKSSMVAF